MFCLEMQIDKPIYKGNSVTTTSGGVVSDENFRVQALNITYTFLENEKNLLTASEDVILQIDGKSYLASKLEYDFLKKEGTLYDLKTQKGELYHGAKKTKIKDKKILFNKAFAYTGENEHARAELTATNAEILPSKQLNAEGVGVKIGDNTLLNLNKTSIDLKPEKRNFTYKVAYSSSTGPSALASYPLYKSIRSTLDTKVEYRPQGNFIAIQTQGTYANKEAGFKATQSTLVYPTTELALDTRAHAKLEYDKNTNFYSTLNIDRVNKKSTLARTSSENLFCGELQKTTLDFHYLAKKHQLDFLFCKNIHPFGLQNEFLPSLRMRSQNFELFQNTLFYHDIEFKHQEFNYPDTYLYGLDDQCNDIALNQYNKKESTLLSSQTLYSPIGNHYFTLTPELTLHEKYFQENNCGFILLNGKLDLNTKFSYSNKHTVSQNKIYAIYETSSLGKYFGDTHKNSIYSDQCFKIPQLAIGGCSSASFKDWDAQLTADSYFYIYPNYPSNTLDISDIHEKIQYRSKNNTYDVQAQINPISRAFTAYSISYTNTISTSEALSLECHHFNTEVLAKNNPCNHKLEALLGPNIAACTPLVHSLLVTTLKYQFSPYPLYNCKLKSSLYIDDKENVKYNLGMDLSTTLYTIYKINANLSYSNKGVGFGFNLNLLQ
jgi:hypothetical protein